MNNLVYESGWIKQMYLKVVEKELRQKFQHEFRFYTHTYTHTHGYMDMCITTYLLNLSQVIPVWEKEREGAFTYIWHVKK